MLSSTSSSDAHSKTPTPVATGYGRRTAGTFHPKLIVALADDKPLVGVGSSNLTSGGFGANLEAWQYFDDSAREVLSGVRRFLEAALDRGILPAAAQLQEVVTALPRQ